MAGSCILGYVVDDARDYLNPKPFPLVYFKEVIS